MKRILNIVVVCLMALIISACTAKGKEPEKIKLGKENNFKETISYQIETISKTQQIAPDVIGSTYNYYKPFKKENMFIDIVMYITNLKQEELKVKDDLYGAFIIDETEYVVANALVSDNGKTVSDSATIAPQSRAKVHLYAEVDPKLLDKEIEFKFQTRQEDNEQVASLVFKLDDISKKYKTKNLNDTVVFEEYSEILLKGSTTTKKLGPVKPTGLYTYYEVNDEANSFIVLDTVVKNNSQDALVTSNVATFKLVDENGHEYPANYIYEKNDQSNLSDASTITLNPGDSATVHLLFEVSDDVINGKKSVRISNNGIVYIVNI